jgi:hypothetical protein
VHLGSRTHREPMAMPPPVPPDPRRTVVCTYREQPEASQDSALYRRELRGRPLVCVTVSLVIVVSACVPPARPNGGGAHSISHQDHMRCTEGSCSRTVLR